VTAVFAGEADGEAPWAKSNFAADKERSKRAAPSVSRLVMAGTLLSV
jgi:hypothetical protein